MGVLADNGYRIGQRFKVAYKNSYDFGEKLTATADDVQGQPSLFKCENDDGQIRYSALNLVKPILRIRAGDALHLCGTCGLRPTWVYGPSGESCEHCYTGPVPVPAGPHCF